VLRGPLWADTDREITRAEGVRGFDGAALRARRLSLVRSDRARAGLTVEELARAVDATIAEVIEYDADPPICAP
jgi:hypothetical protein